MWEEQNTETETIQKAFSCSLGIHTIGIYALGIHAIGIHAIGIHAIGIHAIGIRAIGIRAIGIRAIGIHAIGIHAIGIHTIGTKNNSDTKEQRVLRNFKFYVIYKSPIKVRPISVLRSLVRSHATHAIGEPKNGK